MGGKSTTEQKSTQQSTTAPWSAAQPTLQGILGQLNTGLSSSAAITGAENEALGRLTANAGNAGQYGQQINSLVNDLFGGGGANNQAGNVNAGFEDYKRRLGLTADGGQIGQNSGLLPYLDTIRTDVSSQVNGAFAGAGRGGSPGHVQALARGIAQGQAPVIAGQYNTDVANMRGAADALYGAGNTTAGLLTGMNQQSLANRQAGVGLSNVNNDQFNNAQKQVLEAEAMRRGIPVQALGLLAQIGIPIAGLGSQSTGTGTTKGTNQMSGAQQFGLIAQGIGNLMPKAPISFGS